VVSQDFVHLGYNIHISIHQIICTVICTVHIIVGYWYIYIYTTSASLWARTFTAHSTTVPAQTLAAEDGIPPKPVQRSPEQEQESMKGHRCKSLSWGNNYCYDKYIFRQTMPSSGVTNI
jgi:hypothetical protein